MKRNLLLSGLFLLHVVADAQDRVSYHSRYKGWLLAPSTKSVERIELVGADENGIQVTSRASNGLLHQASVDTARHVPIEEIGTLTFQDRVAKGRGAIIGTVLGLGVSLFVAASYFKKHEDDGLGAIDGRIAVSVSVPLATVAGLFLGRAIAAPKRQFVVNGNVAEFQSIRPQLQVFKARSRR